MGNIILIYILSKKEGKFKQLKYSITKLEKCLDILFIIDKL